MEATFPERSNVQPHSNASTPLLERLRGALGKMPRGGHSLGHTVPCVAHHGDVGPSPAHEIRILATDGRELAVSDI